MKKEIISSLIWYANRVSETVQYKSWSDEFCRKEINEVTDVFLTNIKKHIDFENLTRKEAYELGFCLWEEGSNLCLIPLYLLPIIPIGTKLKSISGEEFIYNGKNVDNDIRFGCIAYGFDIPEGGERE